MVRTVHFPYLGLCVSLSLSLSIEVVMMMMMMAQMLTDMLKKGHGSTCCQIVEG